MQRGYLDRPDCRLYYEVDGSGPFLVFAHGLGGNHLSWWQQVPHFRDRYTCVTFAHRGFAPSSAPPAGPDPTNYAGDLAALIEHLDAREVAVCFLWHFPWASASARADAFSRRTLSGTACPWSPDFPLVPPFGVGTSGRPAD